LRRTHEGQKKTRKLRREETPSSFIFYIAVLEKNMVGHRRKIKKGIGVKEIP
jgi:hypothetical protein